MGAIKEKMFEIAEVIQDLLDEGIQDNEIDEYLEIQLSPEDYEFYQQNKEVIFEFFMGYMGESLTMPKLEEGCNCGKKRTITSLMRRSRPPAKAPIKPTIKKPLPNKLHEDLTMHRLVEQEEKYNVSKLVKVACNSLSKWVSKIDQDIFIEYMENLKNKPDLTREEVSNAYYDFFDTHINNFFEVFLKHNMIEKNFLYDSREEIIEGVINVCMRGFDEWQSSGDYSETEEDPVLANAMKKSKELYSKNPNDVKKNLPKDYPKMNKYDLRKEIDSALDRKDYETLKKIYPYLKEGFLKSYVEETLNEEYTMNSLSKPIINKK